MTSVLHPVQFQVNEAWIVFQLNETPIHTEQEGSFNCLCLMDAASCFLLGPIPVGLLGGLADCHHNDILPAMSLHSGRSQPSLSYVDMLRSNTTLSPYKQWLGPS